MFKLDPFNSILTKRFSPPSWILFIHPFFRVVESQSGSTNDEMLIWCIWLGCWCDNEDWRLESGEEEETILLPSFLKSLEINFLSSMLEVRLELLVLRELVDGVLCRCLESHIGDGLRLAADPKVGLVWWFCILFFSFLPSLFVSPFAYERTMTLSRVFLDLVGISRYTYNRRVLQPAENVFGRCQYWYKYNQVLWQKATVHELSKSWRQFKIRSRACCCINGGRKRTSIWVGQKCNGTVKYNIMVCNRLKWATHRTMSLSCYTGGFIYR